MLQKTTKVAFKKNLLEHGAAYMGAYWDNQRIEVLKMIEEYKDSQVEALSEKAIFNVFSVSPSGIVMRHLANGEKSYLYLDKRNTIYTLGRFWVVDSAEDNHCVIYLI